MWGAGQVAKPAVAERQRAMEAESRLAEAIATQGQRQERAADEQKRATDRVVDRLDTMLMAMGTKPDSPERRSILRRHGVSVPVHE